MAASSPGAFFTFRSSAPRLSLAQISVIRRSASGSLPEVFFSSAWDSRFAQVLYYSQCDDGKTFGRNRDET